MRTIGKCVVCFCLLFFYACGSHDRQEWLVTTEGAKIYLNDTISTLFSLPRYSWDGGRLQGLAHGKGLLTIRDEDGKEVWHKELCAYYGNLDSESVTHILQEGQGYFGDVDSENNPDGYGVLVHSDRVYVGTFEDGECTGTVAVFAHDTLLYRGEWKDGLFNGIGTAYYPNGKKCYEGNWEAGEYDGEGIYYDEKGNPHRHVWTEGKLKEATLQRYETLEKYKVEMPTELYNSLKVTYYNWERLYIWVYVGFFSLLLLLWVILLNIYHKEKYYEIAPLEKSVIYRYWLFGGFWGMHKARLGSDWGYVEFLLFASLIMMNVDNIFLYVLYPSVWGILPQWGICTKIIASFVLIFWIYDGCRISYNLYIYINKYFRRSEYELDILNGNKTAVENYYEHLASVADERNQELQKLLREAQECATRVNPTAEWKKNFGGGLDWEKQRFAELQGIANKMNDVYKLFHDDCLQMSAYLTYARLSAYRNLYLAKELIQLIHKISGREQTIQEDDLAFSQINVDIQMPQVDFEMEEAIGGAITQAFSSYDAMLKSGWGKNVAKGAAIVTVLSAAVEIVESRNELREELAKKSLEVVQEMDKGMNEIMANEGKLLRASELLSALFNANKAFVMAYVELRDLCFGEISYENFKNGPKTEQDIYHTTDFKQKMQHLIMICSEYNKINQQTIHSNDEEK